MRKPAPETLENPFAGILEGLRDPRAVHVIDDLWSVLLEDETERAYVNLPEHYCSAHREFPCIHVEAIEVERARLIRVFDIAENEPITDSDRLALRAIHQAIYGKESARG